VAADLNPLSASQPEATVSGRPAAILYKYQFELILVGVELLAGLLVALVLFKLFWPAVSNAQIALTQTNRSRPIRLTRGARPGGHTVDK
jgi:hypothetical protein